MGTYYTASSIIGYKFERPKAGQRKVPNCPHNPSTSAAFCPDCGKPVGFHTQLISNSEWEKFRYEFIEERQGGGLPKGYKFEQSFDGETCWIGYGAQIGQHSDEFRMTPLKPYTEIQEEITNMLHPFTDVGLFQLETRNFALWTVYTGR